MQAQAIGEGVRDGAAEGWPLTVEYDLTLDDYRALSAHLRPPEERSNVPLYLLFAGFAAVALVAVALGRSGMQLVFGMIIAGVLVALYFKEMSSRVAPPPAPSPGGTVLCRHSLTLEDDGVLLRTPYWTSHLRWAGIRAVEEAPGHIFLRTDSVAACAVPKAAFADTEQQRSFVAFARGRLAA